MAIVDAFTKLIFGEEQAYSSRELLIVQALRVVDIRMVRHSHQEMGGYLRNMSVREMIQLVSRMRDQLSESTGALPSDRSPEVGAAIARQPQ
jgi:hypothetical protein